MWIYLFIYIFKFIIFDWHNHWVFLRTWKRTKILCAALRWDEHCSITYHCAMLTIFLAALLVWLHGSIFSQCFIKISICVKEGKNTDEITPFKSFSFSQLNRVDIADTIKIHKTSTRLTCKESRRKNLPSTQCKEMLF
jgi:hypothetical protein